jgi:hypothetical protein
VFPNPLLDAFLNTLERHPVHIEAIGFHPFWLPDARPEASDDERR